MTTEIKLRAADLHWREIDGEVIGLEARASTYVAANLAGSLLWRALVAGSTRERLAHELVYEYGIAPERAAADVDAFVTQLAAHGLLEA
jgi:hypothetical protein